jgi:hypothetical protein
MLTEVVAPRGPKLEAAPVNPTNGRSSYNLASCHTRRTPARQGNIGILWRGTEQNEESDTLLGE